MNKKRIMLCGLMALAMVLVMTPMAWAQHGKGFTTVYAVGDSPIRGEDMSASRQEAIAGSLIAAVTDILTDMVSREIMVGNFQILNEIILNRAEQFVRDYKVLTESTQGKRHRVMVQASVSSRRLKNALKKAGIHLGQKPYPTVLFCLAEKGLDAVNYQYWWGDEQQLQVGPAARSLHKVLKSKGYKIISPRKVQGMENYPPELSVAEAVALGQQLGAQVVVVGQAVTDEASNTMGGTVRSFRGTLSARAYRVDTSEELAQSQRSALQASEDPNIGAKEALNNATLLSGEDLGVQVADAWFSMQSSQARTEVSIEGIGGQIASFVKFRGALRSMSGVESVQLKEMMPDIALLSVEYQGSTRGLAEELLRQNFVTFGINIIETTGSSIRLQLVPR